MVKELITQRILNLNFLLEDKDAVEYFYQLIVEAVLNNNKIFLCGYGEGADLSNNLARILNFCFYNLNQSSKFKNSTEVVSLNFDNSLISSIANQTSFDDIFKVQIEKSGKADDILVVFSFEGTNKNIIEAVKQAKFQNMKVILLTGKTKLNYNIDLEINAIGETKEQINEIHTAIGHIIFEMIMKNFG